MLKKVLVVMFIFVMSVNVFCESIVAYVPDAMMSVEKSIATDFKKKTGHDIKFVPMKSIISRMKLEKKNPKSDLAIGITPVASVLGKKENLFYKYTPKNINNITNEKFIFDKEGFIVPFGYSLLGINYNKAKLAVPPKSFKEISSMKKVLLMEDPRSSTGQEVMLWSIAIYGDKWLDFWKEMKPSILSVTSDWDDCFAKFQTGEAVMMTGFATSNAFFVEDPKSTYSTFIPSEGGYIYADGAAITNKKVIKEATKEFMNYILTPDAQNIFVKEYYELPVTNIKLEFPQTAIPTTDKIFTLDPEYVSKNLEMWQNQLIKLLSE